MKVVGSQVTSPVMMWLHALEVLLQRLTVRVLDLREDGRKRGGGWGYSGSCIQYCSLLFVILVPPYRQYRAGLEVIRLDIRLPLLRFRRLYTVPAASHGVLPEMGVLPWGLHWAFMARFSKCLLPHLFREDLFSFASLKKHGGATYQFYCALTSTAS